MDIYTTQQITKILNIGRSTLNKLALENDLGRMMGRERVFLQEDLDRLRTLVAAMPGRGAPDKPRSPRKPKPEQTPTEPA